MNAEKRKIITRFLYIIATILIIVLIGLLDPNLIGMFDAIKSVNLLILSMGFLSLLLFWISDALLLNHITSYIYQRVPFGSSLKVGVLGLYYGALTPFATGGQPMQVVYMKRDDIPYGISMCIVTVKFIVYELSLCLFYVVAMLVRGGYFYRNFNQVFWITTLGFLINLAAVVLIVFIMINKNIPHKICNGFISFLTKIKIIKKPEKRRKALNTMLEDFHTSVQYIVKFKARVAVSIIISGANLFFLFAIPYFIYLAFGHFEKSIVDLVTMQSFLSLAVSFFPLPGASGASEGGFYLFYSSFFTKVPVFVAMLIWRLISYYTVIVTGFLIVITDEILKLRKKKKEI